MANNALPDWEEVLSSRLAATHPARAVLVRGTASAVYAKRWLLTDADHVRVDLRERFDPVLADREAVAGPKTTRIQGNAFGIAGASPGDFDGAYVDHKFADFWVHTNQRTHSTQNQRGTRIGQVGPTQPGSAYRLKKPMGSANGRGLRCGHHFLLVRGPGLARSR